MFVPGWLNKEKKKKFTSPNVLLWKVSHLSMCIAFFLLKNFVKFYFSCWARLNFDIEMSNVDKIKKISQKQAMSMSIEGQHVAIDWNQAISFPSGSLEHNFFLKCFLCHFDQSCRRNHTKEILDRKDPIKTRLLSRTNLIMIFNDGPTIGI